MKNGRVGVIVLHEVSSDQARLLGMLFPHLDGLEFVGVRAGDAGLVVVARTAPEPGLPGVRDTVFTAA